MSITARFHHSIAPVLAALWCMFSGAAAQAAAPTDEATVVAARAKRSVALRRYAPTDGTLELGLYSGLLIPAHNHSFFGTQWRAIQVTGSLGARIGYYPLRWFGGEVEAGGFPGRTADWQYFNAFALRGHAVLQLPYFRFVPFVLVGAGKLVVRTPNQVLGSDIDPAAYLGVGLKFRVRRWLTLRMEWRGSMTGGREAVIGKPAVHNELLLGVSFTFGPRPRP